MTEGSDALHVAGRVVAPPDRGLAGAEIVLLPVETAYDEAVRRATGRDLEAVARVIADRRGRFALEVPAPGMWRLVARSKGRLPLVRHELPLMDSVEAPPAELPRDEGVTVTVLGPFGSPVAGAQVRVVDGQGGLSGGGWSAWRETVTTDSASSGPLSGCSRGTPCNRTRACQISA
ncbi:MAG TPA: carboxypeptidase-like regulatory domain-containing protein [Gemmatimonadales bacterium]|nr:carboxypeptidase-like regulatory domain-containing protein [Gemmatimonadales bacterium]